MNLNYLNGKGKETTLALQIPSAETTLLKESGELEIGEWMSAGNVDVMVEIKTSQDVMYRHWRMVLGKKEIRLSICG